MLRGGRCSTSNIIFLFMNFRRNESAECHSRRCPQSKRGTQSKWSRWDAHVPQKSNNSISYEACSKPVSGGFDSRCNYEYFLTAYCVFVLPIQTPSTGSHWGPDMSASNKQTRTNNWISFDFNAKGDLESSPIKINDTRIPSSRNVGLYIKYLIFCFFFLPWWLVRNFNFVENWIALSRGFHTPTILGECLKWKRL